MFPGSFMTASRIDKFHLSAAFNGVFVSNMAGFPFTVFVLHSRFFDKSRHGGRWSGKWSLSLQSHQFKVTSSSWLSRLQNGGLMMRVRNRKHARAMPRALLRHESFVRRKAMEREVCHDRM